MLQYPGTKAYQSALFGLADQSHDTRQKWHYYQRLIDECTASDVPGLSWYLLGHEHLLWLAEDDRSLASDDQLDELIDRLLESSSFPLPGYAACVQSGLYSSSNMSAQVQHPIGQSIGDIGMC